MIMILKMNNLLLKSQFRRFSLSSHKKAVIAVANGSEEIETVTIIDILRRAEIIVNVSKVSEDANNLECIMSRGVKLVWTIT